MIETISRIDWLIIGVYLAGLILLSLWLSRGQHSRDDYYVAGHETGAWPISISIMATQCSTNSILGAPAFVAFAAGGGLIWLQYELALPLAMIVIMIFLLPTFRQLDLISVYDYLERRFDLKTRLILSGLFQILRAFATAVTVYSIAIVIEVITGLSFLWSVLLLGVITVVYDVLGGIRAVIYSDVLQMVILVTALLIVLFILLDQFDGITNMLEAFPAQRRTAIDFAHHGLGDSYDFAFWPMLLGGLFLYVSYYGCDQSQVQRELCCRNLDDGNWALFINGLLRFPVVLLYCLVGVGIGVYAMQEPSFVDSIPADAAGPNYNLAVPLFMIQQLPTGLVGLALVALFAAAMSSLDSVLNSLSATTMEDFVRRFHGGANWSADRELLYSRGLTLFWGVVTLWLAFHVDDIAETVLVAINKIGSLINGPVLAVFALGLLTRRARGSGACIGLLVGFLVNLYCWQMLPGLSWLWWNVIGLALTFCVGYGISLFHKDVLPVRAETLWSPRTYSRFDFRLNWTWRYVLLAVWFFTLLLLMVFYLR